MFRLLDRWWRIIGTGISFVVFGISGLVIGGLILPVARRLIRDPRQRQQHARSVIAWAFRWFIRLMRALGVIDYELRNFDRLKRNGLLVLANHPSLIDTVFLLGFIQNSTCVADEHLFENSYTGSSLRAAGYIRNDAGLEVLSHCVSALDSGANVLIFPEGTRTPISAVVRLRRGAANIAIRGERDVTPVIIRCTPRTLMKGKKWWQVPSSVPFFTILVGEDIAVRSFSVDGEPPALAVRRLTAYLEQYFNTESVAHAVP